MDVRLCGPNGAVVLFRERRLAKFRQELVEALSPGNMTGPELVFESIVPQGIVHHDAYGVPDDRAY